MIPAPVNIEPVVLSAAFNLLFRKGRSPPSCPAPKDADLLNRIRDAVPAASPAACRGALIRVRRLSSDVTEICMGFCEGEYGEGERARTAALSHLEAKNPGFTAFEYRTAFAVGLMWTGLE